MNNTTLTLKRAEAGTAEHHFGRAGSAAHQDRDVGTRPPKPTQAESRRDRVAINAMQALIARDTRFGFRATDASWRGSVTTAQHYAAEAFDFADAFLAEREKRGGARE